MLASRRAPHWRWYRRWEAVRYRREDCLSPANITSYSKSSRIFWTIPGRRSAPVRKCRSWYSKKVTSSICWGSSRTKTARIRRTVATAAAVAIGHRRRRLRPLSRFAEKAEREYSKDWSKTMKCQRRSVIWGKKWRICCWRNKELVSRVACNIKFEYFQRYIEYFGGHQLYFRKIIKQI